MSEVDELAGLVLALSVLRLLETHLRAVAEKIRSCESPLVQEPPDPEPTGEADRP